MCSIQYSIYWMINLHYNMETLCEPLCLSDPSSSVSYFAAFVHHFKNVLTEVIISQAERMGYKSSS